MERKIGEIFEYDGNWYQCVKDSMYDYCRGCTSFKNLKCTTFYSNIDCSLKATCKKLEKVGEPYLCNYYLDKEALLMQPYRYYGKDTDVKCPNAIHAYIINRRDKIVAIEIKQNKENMKDNKKQTSLNSTKGIYEKFKGKTVQCLVNNKDGDLVNGYGIVCGYTDKYLIIGFTNGYEGCIKSFTDNVFLENRDFLSYRFWNISHVDDKPLIKPFNLEAARSGKPVCTRDGRKARIICFDRRLFYKNESYPILALVEYPDGGDDVCGYNEKGKARIRYGTEYKDDLMMLSEKKEGWVNVAKEPLGNNEVVLEYIFNSYEDAVRSGKANERYIATVRIEWEE